MNLRTRLIAVFVLATLLPLGLTLWTTLQLVDRSLELAPLNELQDVTQSLEETGRGLYQQAREDLRRDVNEGRMSAVVAPKDTLDEGAQESFVLGGKQGEVLHYYVRHGEQVLDYSRELRVPLKQIQGQISDARKALEVPQAHDIRGGFSRTLILVSAGLWVGALAVLIFLASKITKPVRQLTRGLGKVATGDLSTRVGSSASGEIGEALVAFNEMAGQMEQAREHLIQVTRVASWQALARKMAHEVKNSLTPIRLTVDEMVSRNGASDPFLEQAAQIVTDEITTLEKRVRAFSDFAAEPPVELQPLDMSALIEERVSFLRTAHPDIDYELPLNSIRTVLADPDLIKGVLTNLLENAAQAVGGSGSIRVKTIPDGSRLNIEVHDSGPGLSEQARATLFEPSISFKKGGMGLGLSIARRSAVLCGGDLQAVEGELGGAAFRLTLPLGKHGE